MDLEDLEKQLKRKIYKESYYRFFIWAFNILFPEELYEDAPHVEFLCSVLQKEAERIRRREEKDQDIIINIPPRTSKSLICSVVFNAWVWIEMPSATFISVSFDEDLSLLNAQLTRDLIKSDQYQALFSDVFQIRSDVDSKSFFMNTKTGFRLSKTIGSNITGHKGLFCFPAGQLISTNRGPIDIAKIVNEKLDVWVNSYCEELQLEQLMPINNYLKHSYTGKLYTIKSLIRDIICTEEHLIFTQRGWVQAKDLTLQDSLMRERSHFFYNIQSLDFAQVENVEVYNLEVDCNNNYYIGSFLVHNCIIDDPQNPKTSESANGRQIVIDYYQGALYNRLTPANLGLRLIVMQRLHQSDLTGHLLKENPNGYRHICLPAEVSEKISPPSFREKYVDGLLDPKRLSKKTLLGFFKTLGGRSYAGQYDQIPGAKEGTIFKRKFWEIILPELVYRDPNVSPIHFVIDTAYTAKTKNDPTALWAGFKKDNILYTIEVREVWLEFGDLCDFIISWTASLGRSNMSLVYIEPKASGKSVVQQLRATTMLNVLESRNPDGDKVTRANAVIPILQANRNILIAGTYIENYLDQLCLFPEATHDDMVDVTVNAINEILLGQNDLDIFFI